MKVFTIQFTEDELTELENVLDQHVYAEVIETKGGEGIIGKVHNRILDVPVSYTHLTLPTKA